jgi:hypothetical protein
MSTQCIEHDDTRSDDMLFSQTFRQAFVLRFNSGKNPRVLGKRGVLIGLDLPDETQVPVETASC